MKKLSPLKAIRAKCLDCSVYQYSEISNCNISDCPLYPYRMGKNPNRKGIGNSSAFTKKTGVETVDSLAASAADVNASVAMIRQYSSTQL